jgi:hypothetical protein
MNFHRLPAGSTAKAADLLAQLRKQKEMKPEI